MPSKSEKQRRFMEGCADDQSRKRMRNCPPKKVARDYRAADRAKARQGKRKSGS